MRTLVDEGSMRIHYWIPGLSRLGQLLLGWEETKHANATRDVFAEDTGLIVHIRRLLEPFRPYLGMVLEESLGTVEFQITDV
jgi:hypothetical protein